VGSSYKVVSLTWAWLITRRDGTLPAGVDTSTAHFTMASEPFRLRAGAAPPLLLEAPVGAGVVVGAGGGWRSSHRAAASSAPQDRGNTYEAMHE
jgi:hypothetical protein